MNESPAGDCFPQRRQDLICFELDDEAVLYDNAFNTTCRLNATAYVIWKLCDGLGDVTAIAEQLSRRYDVSAAQARQDVRNALGQMFADGLLVRKEHDSN